MHHVRPYLLVAVIVNALVALYLRANEIPMPGWFAGLLATSCLALLGSRLVRREVPSTSRASRT